MLSPERGAVDARPWRFVDILPDAVYRLDGTIGAYQLERIGSVLNAPSGRFASRYPDLYALASAVHDLRYESMASRPLIGKSGKPTKRIDYKFLPVAKRMLTAAVKEIAASGIL